MFLKSTFYFSNGIFHFCSLAFEQLTWNETRQSFECAEILKKIFQVHVSIRMHIETVLKQCLCRVFHIQGKKCTAYKESISWRKYRAFFDSKCTKRIICIGSMHSFRHFSPLILFHNVADACARTPVYFRLLIVSCRIFFSSSLFQFVFFSIARRKRKRRRRRE